MKNLLIILSFATFGFGLNSDPDGDCLDFAIESLERAEAFRGEMYDDLEATVHLNNAFAMCWGQN